jgi:HK97 family phage prohead protease
MDRLEFKSEMVIDDAGMISGIAWPFGSADRSGDIIEKGAFTGARTPLPMLFGHNDPIGVWESIEENAAGLQVKGRLLIDDVARAKEARALVMAGALGGLSIGFSTRKSYSRKGGGRTIQALDLVEVSLVSVPMHPGARVTGAKSAAAYIQIAEAINRAAAALK